MKTHSDQAPLDLFPSESDAGAPNTTPDKTGSAPALGRNEEPSERVTVLPDETREREPSTDAPDSDSSNTFRMSPQGPPATARMPGRGLAIAICGTAVLGACLVAGIVWVTLGSIATDPTPASAEANGADQPPDRSQPR